MRGKDKVWFIILAALLALAVAGCAGKQAGKTADKTIKIASAVPLSGTEASLGESFRLGAQMAFDERKASFEKLGFELQYTPADDKADVQAGTNVAKQLAADKDVLAVMGHWNSGISIPASDIYEAQNLCMVSPGSTAVQLTDRGLPNVNRICARDDVQGPLGADFMVTDLGLKKVFVIHDNTVAGRTQADEFKKRAQNIAADIVGYEEIASGEKDFTKVLEKVAAAKPQVLYFAGYYPEGSLIIKQIKEKKIDATFIGLDGMDDPHVVSIAGPAVVGSYYTSPAAGVLMSAQGKEWASRFKEKFGKEPGNWAAYGYDAMNVILEGVQKSIQANGGKKPTRQQVCEYVRSMQNFQGVTSVISFDKKGDNRGAKLYVAEYKEAKYPPAVVKEIKAGK